MNEKPSIVTNKRTRSQSNNAPTGKILLFVITLLFVYWQDWRIGIVLLNLTTNFFKNSYRELLLEMEN